MATPVVVISSGVPVVPVANGLPVTVADNGLGIGVTISTTGTPVTGLFVDETMALISRMSAAPTPQRANLIDTLVRSLKAAGVWTKLDALYLLAAADSQAARLNWIGSSYTISAVASPTFTADRGYAGDGAASYLDTGFNPSTAAGKFARNDAYFGFWSRTAAQQAGSCAGYFNGTDGITRLTRSTGNEANGRINQAAGLSSATSGAQTDGSGLIGAARSGAGANRLSRNGVNVATGTDASTALPNGTLRFGNFGTAVFSAIPFAAGVIGQNLTVAEDLVLYTALQTYMTAVGA